MRAKSVLTALGSFIAAAVNDLMTASSLVIVHASPFSVTVSVCFSSAVRTALMLETAFGRPVGIAAAPFLELAVLGRFAVAALVVLILICHWPAPSWLAIPTLGQRCRTGPCR